MIIKRKQMAGTKTPSIADLQKKIEQLENNQKSGNSAKPTFTEEQVEQQKLMAPFKVERGNFQTQ